jgi:guanylate kinase
VEVVGPSSTGQPDRTGRGVLGSAHLDADQPGSAQPGPSGRPAQAGRGRRGRIVVVSGPSGVGKGAIVARVRALMPDLRFSVSATTRPARPGEAHGQHYWFLTPEEFSELIERDGFLEWADVFGRRYGTPREPVEAELAQGHDVILEVNIDGAAQVRAQVAKGTDVAHLIFIRPPSMPELERRLRSRATESDEQIRLRLATATAELAAEPEFDESIVNDDLDTAAAEVAAAIRRLREADAGPVP